jgi:hypothetical protein
VSSGPYIVVAGVLGSAPLDDQDATVRGFYLRRIGEALWLRGYWSSAGHIWSPDDVFVFARRGPV